MAAGGIGDLTRVLEERRLLALLGGRALQIPGTGLPASFREAVSRRTEANRARGRALQLLAASACSGLGDEGIRAMALKGPFLAQRIHGDPGLRETNDLDLLIEARDAKTAISVLSRIGYVATDPQARPGALPGLHWTLEGRDNGLPRIDLHWRIHWYESLFARGLLARAEPDGEGMLSPAPRDELAALLLFYARDGFSGLRAAADIAAMWEHLRDDDAPLLAEHWDSHSPLRPAFQAAALTAERVVGVPAETLVPPARAGRRVRTAVALGDWSQSGERDQLTANVDLVDGLLAPRDQLGGFLRRQVFVPRQEIVTTYGLDPNRRARVAYWRVAHVPRRLARFCLGLLAGLRRPGPAPSPASRVQG